MICQIFNFKNTARFAVFILFVSLSFSKPAEIQAQQSGITPENSDGFETGDWRNFRPNYVGSSDDFIRPRFDVTNTNPISGQYSLRWTGGNTEHEWLMLSNAFYLSRPISASVLFRTDEESGDWQAGFYLMQDYDFFSGVRISKNGISHQLDANEWGLTEKEDVAIEPGKVYKLSVSLDERNRFTASVSDKENGYVIYEESAISATLPGAIVLYVKTNEDSDIQLYFDDVTVESGEYLVKSGEWTRSPMPNYVVLPRLPDVTQEEGNWVGGHSVMKTGEGDYLMWYRIRDNQQRGKGYGFATSSDGLNWQKYDDNPVFVPHSRYDSNEKITVLKIDGVFRGWYTVEYEGLWITKHIESSDGINWENDQPVIDDVLCKDADVVYLEGEYYLYCIGLSYTDISVYTSDDGIDWELREVYEMGTHRHLAAYYEKENSLFALYPTAGGKGVSYAVSQDGIKFEPFLQEWSPPSVGLDDWIEAGITYLSFLRNEHGHIQDENYRPVYYQARNTYDNNIPSWLYHGGERVVLAGKFEGIYTGIPAIIKPDGTYRYEAFPFEVERARNFNVRSTDNTRIVLNEWNPGGQSIARGSIEMTNTVLVQWVLKSQTPGTDYQILIGEEEAGTGRADENGTVLIRTVLDEPGEFVFELSKH